MEPIVTWFALILISLFIYLKILNYNHVTVFKIICGVLFSVILSYFAFRLRTPIPYVRFAIMILALGVFASVMSRTRFDLAFTGIIISIGIGYGFSLVATLICAFTISLFSLSIDNILVKFLSFSMQILFVNGLFKIKRFKKGVPFLKERGSGVIGLVISVFIFIVVILIGNENITDKTRMWLLIGAFLCVTGLIFWWRHGLTKLYRERVRERSVKEYEMIIEEKDKQIQKLQESNDFMSKLIHRDNKLLPAMYEMVKIFFDNQKENIDKENQASAKIMLEQIGQIMKKRTGTIMQDQREHKTIPTTKVDLIDGIMNHMMSKAAEKEIQFDLVVAESILDLTETVIPAIKLETLSADLIENAIIAASHNEYRRILVTFGIADGFYELNVQDSGIPFETHTLMDLGIQKASTHLDEGGSGIGYMTIFEILHDFNVSLIITEYEPIPYRFTKSVKIRFDNKNEYIVKTYRTHEFLTLQARLDMSVGFPIILPQLSSASI